MSCQLYWNLRDYQIAQVVGQNIISGVLTAPVFLPGIKNETLLNVEASLELSVSKTFIGKKERLLEEYKIIFTIENDILGSLTVNTAYTQQQTLPFGNPFVTRKKYITGTVVGRNIFKRFDNGTVVLEFDEKTGERRLTLFES
jgi:hypothetical protein